MINAVLLAIIAGCADAIGLLRFNTFAGAMTGNTAFLGLSLLSPHPARAVLYSAVIVAFCAGIVLARVAQRLGIAPRPALVLTILILIGCNFGHSRWIAVVLASAMGVQNASTRDVAMALNTTFLTGDLQKLMDGIATYVAPAPPRERAQPRGLVTIASLWASYVGGAALGVISDRWFALPFLVPAGLLLLFLLCPDITKEVQS
jgi:uncharacterized membrane protein YoaK (UPF0700 family)